MTPRKCRTERCGIFACYTADMETIAIPKRFIGKGDLVVVPKKDLDELIARAGEPVAEQDVLRWSREARKLHRARKLPKLT